jgi:hypothetical protein
MKKLILLGISFGVFACSSTEVPSVTQAPTTIKVEQLFEFGQVKQGEIVKAKFTITNTGEVPLNIVRVEPSCGCTVANYTKEPILPGKSGWVSGEVNTDRFEGEIRKSLNVLANTSPTTTTLIIKGIVNK